jgi:hypothetical protein
MSNKNKMNQSMSQVYDNNKFFYPYSNTGTYGSEYYGYPYMNNNTLPLDPAKDQLNLYQLQYLQHQQHMSYHDEYGKVNPNYPYINPTSQLYSQQQQQPIVQNNYINNFSFYPMNTGYSLPIPDFKTNKSNPNHIKEVDDKDKEKPAEPQPKEEDICKNKPIEFTNSNFIPKTPEDATFDYSDFNSYNVLQTGKFKEYQPQYTGLSLNNNQKSMGTLYPYESFQNNETSKITANLTNKDVDSSQQVNNDQLGSNLGAVDMSKKRLKMSEDYSSLQKRLERMSLNDSISITEALKNNDFVEYVYNYRFSINDREDLNINTPSISNQEAINEKLNTKLDNYNFNFSPSIVGLKGDFYDNNAKKINGEELPELKEVESEVSRELDDDSGSKKDKEEEEGQNFNYNKYYNSLFGNKTPDVENN